MEHSPDGKAYLLAQGAEENDERPRPCVRKGGEGTPFEVVKPCEHEKMQKAFGSDREVNFANGNLSWIMADQVYLARVLPSPETINDEDAYEYFAGHDGKGQPIWTDDINELKLLLEWNNKMGRLTRILHRKLSGLDWCYFSARRRTPAMPPSSMRHDSSIRANDPKSGTGTGSDAG